MNKTFKKRVELACAELGIPKLKTGTYVGNGETTHAITGVGFQPKSLEIAEKVEGDGQPIVIIENN